MSKSSPKRSSSIGKSSTVVFQIVACRLISGDHNADRSTLIEYFIVQRSVVASNAQM